MKVERVGGSMRMDGAEGFTNTRVAEVYDERKLLFSVV